MKLIGESQGGTDGTTVPRGTIVAVLGNDNAQFATQNDALINIADDETFKSSPIELVAVNSGPFEAAIGTLTNIVSPVGGLDSFTNEDAARIGANAETDAELKFGDCEN